MRTASYWCLFACFHVLIWNKLFFLLSQLCSPWWWIATRGRAHTQPSFFWMYFPCTTGPVSVTLSETLNPQDATTKKYQLNVLNVKLQSSLPWCPWVTQGCGGVQWLRLFGAMTSVLLEQIEREEEEEKKKRERERERERGVWELGFWKQRRKILCYSRTERWEERLMGWVKGKQLQHRDSLFWRVAKGRSSPPLNG